jgi:hypothetical protein
MMDDLQSQLTPDAFVAYASRAKLTLAALGCGAFLVIGIFIWREGGTDYRIFAAIDWGFFGLMLLLALARILRAAPSLIINQFGIFDNSSAFGGYLLPWEEIHSFYVSSIKNQKFISIRVHDLERFLGRQPAMRAGLMRMNMKLVGAPVNIATASLPLKMEELWKIIYQRCPAGPIQRSQEIVS